LREKERKKSSFKLFLFFDLRYNWGMRQGMTLIELMVVILIIGILATIVSFALTKAYELSYTAQAKEEFNSVRNSVEMYVDDHGGYPPDTNRDIPPGLESYLAPGLWPDAAWPGSVFDWENWTDPETVEKIYQISIRFCPLGDPSGCRFPKQGWAEDFDYYSSVYYCISGPCRSHIDRPINHPGYCVNCN